MAVELTPHQATDRSRNGHHGSQAPDVDIDRSCSRCIAAPNAVAGRASNTTVAAAAVLGPDVAIWAGTAGFFGISAATAASVQNSVVAAGAKSAGIEEVLSGMCRDRTRVTAFCRVRRSIASATSSVRRVRHSRTVSTAAARTRLPRDPILDRRSRPQSASDQAILGQTG